MADWTADASEVVVAPSTDVTEVLDNRAAASTIVSPVIGSVANGEYHRGSHVTTSAPAPAASGTTTMDVSATIDMDPVTEATGIVTDSSSVSVTVSPATTAGMIGGLSINFEDGIDGWTSSNATLSIETVDPLDGTQSMRITGTGAGTAWVNRTITGLVIGRLYRFSALSALLGPGGRNAYVTFAGTEYAAQETLSENIGPSTIYGEFTASAVSIDFAITFSYVNYPSTPSIDQSLLVDRIIIEEVLSFVDDFESYALGTPPSYPTSLWLGGYVDMSVTDATAHTGAQSMLLEFSPTGTGNTWASVSSQFYFALQVSWPWGRTYTASAWVFVPAGEQPATMVMALNNSGAAPHAITASSTVTDAWEQLSVTISSDDMAEFRFFDTPGIIFSLSDPDSPGTYYIDDVSFTWDDSALGTGHVVIDSIENYPDFATAFSYNWWGNSVSGAIDETVMHSGTRSLLLVLDPSDVISDFIYDIPGAKAYIPGVVPPAPDMTIAAWVYVPSGSAAVSMVSTDTTNGMAYASSVTTMFDEWEQLTLVYPNAALLAGNLYNDVYFISADTALGATFYVDDLLGILGELPSRADTHAYVHTTASAHVGAVLNPTAQAREISAVNQGLTPVAPPTFAGLCLNADVSLGSLVLNTMDSDGVIWVCTDIDGWWNMPDPEVKDYPRGFGDGSYDVQGRWLARNITLNGVFLTPDRSYVPGARDRLIRAANIVHSGTWLRVAEDPLKTSYVRLSGKPNITTTNARGRTEFSIGLRAADPIKYSWNDADPDGYASVTIPCKSQAGGNNGTEAVYNDGNYPVKVLIQIDGPIVGPAIIENATTGEMMLLIAPVASGSMLEISTYRQEVSYDGETLGMRSMLDAPTNWAHLTPGVNAFTFEDTGDVNSTAVMRVFYRSGWIG